MGSSVKFVKAEEGLYSTDKNIVESGVEISCEAGGMYWFSVDAVLSMHQALPEHLKTGSAKQFIKLCTGI